jgi:uncharacterized RDD family membrane protein YckC
MAGDDLTPGDPLGPPAPEMPRSSSGYGGDRVPPGAFAPREREEVVNRFADAEPAGWWRRVGATLLDAVIIWVIGAILLGIALGAIGAFDDDTTGVTAAVVTALVAIGAVTVGALIYAPAVMAATNGKTLGKMAAGIRVVRADGRDIDFGWAALREVVVKALALGIAGAATGGIAYLVDVLWPLFDKRKRALHDIVVDSRVIRG